MKTQQTGEVGSELFQGSVPYQVLTEIEHLQASEVADGGPQCHGAFVVNDKITKAQRLQSSEAAESLSNGLYIGHLVAFVCGAPETSDPHRTLLATVTKVKIPQ